MATNKATTKTTKATTKVTAKATTQATAKRFRVKLEALKGMAALRLTIPFDVYEVFGSRARVPVRGTINGFAFRSSVFPVGDGTHYMVANRAMREGGDLKGGDTASVTLERDDVPRTITPPTDFARVLKTDDEARAAWEKVSYSHKKEFVLAIEDAKTPETRERRIRKALAELVARKK
jgi:hypothetical protein